MYNAPKNKWIRKIFDYKTKYMSFLIEEIKLKKNMIKSWIKKQDFFVRM